MFSFPYRLIFTQILVLQLSGAKEWRHCRTKRSASCTTYEDADLDDLACETVVLEPGDALFLPRGVVHGAVAVDAASVHLTIGLGGHRCEARRQLQDVVCMTVADHGGTACPAGTFNEGSGTYDASSCDGSCDYLGDCNSACNTCTGCESCSDRDEDVCAADGAVLLGCGGAEAGACVPAPTPVPTLCRRHYKAHAYSGEAFPWGEVAWSQLCGGASEDRNVTVECGTFGPTSVPTAVPSSAPSFVPTPSPTALPSSAPTPSPTSLPIPAPTVPPSSAPTKVPISAPTSRPTVHPSPGPTTRPTWVPWPAPTTAPTPRPSPAPIPSSTPTTTPTTEPTKVPTTTPTTVPTSQPSEAPSPAPSKVPTGVPTEQDPTPVPTKGPTSGPTEAPIPAPSPRPTNTRYPTPRPSPAPSTQVPTPAPSAYPTPAPTPRPVVAPENDDDNRDHCGLVESAGVWSLATVGITMTGITIATIANAAQEQCVLGPTIVFEAGTTHPYYITPNLCSIGTKTYASKKTVRDASPRKVCHKFCEAASEKGKLELKHVQGLTCYCKRR